MGLRVHDGLNNYAFHTLFYQPNIKVPSPTYSVKLFNWLLYQVETQNYWFHHTSTNPFWAYSKASQSRLTIVKCIVQSAEALCLFSLSGLDEELAYKIDPDVGQEYHNYLQPRLVSTTRANQVWYIPTIEVTHSLLGVCFNEPIKGNFWRSRSD